MRVGGTATSGHSERVAAKFVDKEWAVLFYAFVYFFNAFRSPTSLPGPARLVSNLNYPILYLR